tara:strand:- start:433 stop:1701 length:1269 start_codon:yes stop_codon:yes gene_type:complete
MRLNTSVKGHAVCEITLPTEAVLEFHARDVRLERTGLHAHLSIFLRKTLLAHSVFNVWRDAERVTLANNAHSMFIDVDAAAYTKQNIRHDLTLFSLALEGWLKEQHSAEDLEPLAHREHIHFWLEPYIMSGAGTILFGPPKRGKSWIVMAMAVSIDAGLSSLWAVDQTPVLFINLERPPGSVRKRLGEVNEALGLPRQRPLRVLNARGKGLATIVDAIEQEVEQGTQVLVLDSLSRAGMGTLLEDKTANSIVDTLNGFGISWLAIGHSPRGDDNHVFGSVHFEAGQDMGVRLISGEIPEGLVLGLDAVQVNDIRRPAKQFYRLIFGDDGLTAIQRAQEGDLPRGDNEAVGLYDSIIDLFENHNGPMTNTDLAKGTGRAASNINRMLKDHAQAFNKRRIGREVYYAPAEWGTASFEASFPDPF